MPTTVGNIIGGAYGGLAGVVVAIPVSIVAGIATGDPGPAFFNISKQTAIGSSYLLGAVFGTPFLPFSYLAPPSKPKHHEQERIPDCDDCASADGSGSK